MRAKKENFENLVDINVEEDEDFNMPQQLEIDVVNMDENIELNQQAEIEEHVSQ